MALDTIGREFGEQGRVPDRVNLLAFHFHQFYTNIPAIAQVAKVEKNAGIPEMRVNGRRKM